MTEVFRIPRIRVQAQVVFAGRRIHDLHMFLSEQAARHMGHERPSDVLNGDREFVPALERDALLFVNLDRVMMITVAAELEYSDEEQALLDAAIDQSTHRRVEVVLEDGMVVSGDVTFVMPEGQRRIQDFLNKQERFFRLRDGDHARLIHKKYVLWASQD